MMGDKSLSMLLAVLFGISGVTILVLAWVQPMPASERILTTIIGSVGLFVALVRARLLKSPQAKVGTEQVLIGVEAKDKP